MRKIIQIDCNQGTVALCNDGTILNLTANGWEILNEPVPQPAEMVVDAPEVAIGSLWRHTNGQVYKVIALANEGTTCPEQYPITVVYQSERAGTTWSRPLSEWHRSMTFLKE